MAVQSVDRALDLLELIGDRPGGLVDVAERAELPLSTASRLLETLRARNAIERTEDGVYRIGAFVQRLGASGGSTAATLETKGAAAIAALADELDEAACISIPIGAETLTLMQIAVPKPVQVEDWTGQRWSITGGGSGAVMMSTWPTERVDRLLEPLTPARRRAFRNEIAEARKVGYSWNHGSYVEGLSSVAAPICDAEGIAIAAVIGYGPSYRFPARGRTKVIASAVVAAGETISRNLEM